MMLIYCCAANSQAAFTKFKHTNSNIEAMKAHQNIVETDINGVKMRAVVEGSDTFPLINLKNIWVYPPLKFKNKKQERFYWRTVRDVKRVLPLVAYIKDVIRDTNDTLLMMQSPKERKKYMMGFERRIYKQNYDKMTKLTYNQGKLLIRLVNREMEVTTYELIKAYRGGFRAGFYQVFAAMFGASLKVEYGSKKEDEIIERVINMVESGQL